MKEKIRTYEEFEKAVKKDLMDRLKDAYHVTEEEIDRYVRNEQDEIRGGYTRYSNGYGRGSLTAEAHFESEVNAVAMSLEWSY